MGFGKEPVQLQTRPPQGYGFRDPLGGGNCQFLKEL